METLISTASDFLSIMIGMVGNIKYKYKVWFVQFFLLMVLIVSLEYISRAGIVGRLTLVPPTEMVTTLVSIVEAGEITDDFARSTFSVVTAFLMATATGVPIGWIIWRYNILLRILDPYLIALYAAPIFVFYPMLIAIFGLGLTPIILIAYGMGVIAIIVNTANGFDKVRDVHRDVGRVLNLSRVQTIRHIYIPAATPYIFTGLKLGVVYSFIGVLASEFILANAGLGYLVAFNYNNFSTDVMYAMILLVVVIAITLNLSLLRIERRLYYRRVRT